MPGTRRIFAGVSGSPGSVPALRQTAQLAHHHDALLIPVPGKGVYRGDGDFWFRRILVPVRAPGQAYPALAVAARICGMTGGVLRLVHVRTCDPPLPIVGRLYLETPGEATAVLEEALLAAWSCGGPPATTVVVDARRGDVAAAIAWQAAAWPADLIVLTRRPRSALSHLVRGSVPDQVMRKASCPVLAIPPAKMTASTEHLTVSGAGRAERPAETHPTDPSLKE